jgi:hypothetical protein
MADWYFDSANGVDANPGTEFAPKKNPHTFAGGSAGDRLLLRRGSEWMLSAVWNTATCPANNITVLPYGDPSYPRPHIGASFDGNTASATIHMRIRTGWSWSDVKVSRPLPTSDIGRSTVEVREAATGARFSYCEFSGGSDGFRVINNVAGVVLEYSEIHGAYNDGVWLQCGDGTIVRGNSIYGHGQGVDLCDGVQASEHTGTLTVEDNRIIMPLNCIKQGIHLTSVATSPMNYVRRNRVHNPGNNNAAIISIEGNGVVERNVVTGLVGNGISFTSRATGQRTAIARYNSVISDWDQNLYGLIVQGAHAKDVVVVGNTLVGRWSRGIYIFSTALPAGSTYTGANNVIDALGAGVAYRNDSAATSISSSNDWLYRVTANSSGSVTLPGVQTGNPLITASGRPLRDSPLLTAGADIGDVRGIGGIQGRKFIGAYAAATLRS